LYGNSPRRGGPPDAAAVPDARVRTGILDGLLAGQPSGDRPGAKRDEDVQESAERDGNMSALRFAELIGAAAEVTGRQGGLRDCDLATESLRIDRLGPSGAPVVMEYRIIPGNGDLELLVEAVRQIKGSCRDPAAQ
jgi:hypothetical protein